MATAQIEHVNITVSDVDATARMLCELFDWRVRWAGEAMHGGRTAHVGTDEQYLAVYTHGGVADDRSDSSYSRRGGLNHVGIEVDDLDAAEVRIRNAGYETYNHGDYEPGRRFYFRDGDGIEYEVLSYRES